MKFSASGNNTPVLAQSSNPSPKIESCFQYYDYGKARAQLAFEKPAYRNQDNATIIGTLLNENTFPLANVTLYAQLKRRNTPQGLLSDGHFITDTFRLLTNLSMLPDERRFVSVKVPLSPLYPSGEYELQYYLLSESGFHYGGRPFLEEDTAGVSTMRIEGDTKPVVHLDPSRFTVNNDPHRTREPIHEYAPGPLSFAIPIHDERKEKKPVQVEIRYYQFEDTFNENSIGDLSVSIPPNDPVVRATFIPPGPGAYVLVARINDPMKSVFRYRFAVAGSQAPSLRLGDLGVTNYPPTKTDKAYVCFQAPAPQETTDTTIDLIVLNAGKKVVAQESVHGSFDGKVQAFGLPLEKLDTPKDFWVQAIVTDTQSKKEITKALTHYSCDMFSRSLSELALAQDQDNKGIFHVTVTDICGKNMNSQATLSQLKVMRGEKLIMELYNVRPIADSYTLPDTLPGQYRIQARAGNKEKNLEFTLSEKQSAPEQKAPLSRVIDYILAHRLQLALAAGSVLTGLGLILLIVWRYKALHRQHPPV